MKKLHEAVVAATLISSVLVSPVSIFAQSPKPTGMVKETTKEATTTMEVTETTTMEKVEYVLPYPGILPDHPLYFLKKLRDQLMEMLITDPIRKAEFYLLQADKKLQMAVFLGAKGSKVLSAELITQAEAAMQKATKTLSAVKEQGKEVPAYIVEKLEKATAKHAEVLQEFEATVEEAQKGIVTAALELVTSLQQELMKLK